MARQIIWSRSAQEDRKEIFSYWNKRNKSNSYSKKLNQLFKNATELLSNHPITGRKTSIKNVRVKIVRDFVLVYKSTDLEIQVLAIFDTRQDPEKLDEIIDIS